MSTIYVPATHHKLIKVCRKILSISNDTLVTYDHVDKVKSIISHLLYKKLYSAKKIAELYDIHHTDFGMFLKKSLGFKLLSVKERSNLIPIIDSKRQYWKNSSFSFNVYDFKHIPGYDLLSCHNWYSKNNRSGIQRDHMVSIKFGWDHNIPASIISHPANCHIMLAIDNTKKREACSITIDELYRRIDQWNNNPHSTINPNPQISYKEKSEIHKNNISKTLTGRVCYNDGISNFWIYPKRGELPNPLWIKGTVKRTLPIGLLGHNHNY